MGNWLLTFNFQAIEYSDDEEEAKVKASRKKERLTIVCVFEVILGA